jgi:hypothetical protein
MPTWLSLPVLGCGGAIGLSPPESLWARAGFDGVDVNNGSTAQSNKISNVYTAFDLTGGDTLKSNTSMNTAYGVLFRCTANTVSGNIFNDSQFGFYQALSVITGNANYNVDTVQSGSCP